MRYFFLLCLLSYINASSILVKNKQISLYVGSEPGRLIDFTVLPDPIVRFELSEDPRNFSTSVQFPAHNIIYDYLHLSTKKSILTEIAINNDGHNYISLGWFSAHTGCKISLTPQNLYYCETSNFFFGTPYPVVTYLNDNELLCIENATFELPNKSTTSQIPICLKHDFNLVQLPQILGPIDRTVNHCYRLHGPSSMLFCTQEMTNSDFTVQDYNQNYITIGLDTDDTYFGITLQNANQSIWFGWNEHIVYEKIDIIIIILFVLLFLYWSLYLSLSNLSETGKCLNYTLNMQKNQKVPIFIASFFLLAIVIYELLNRDLYFRIQYVHYNNFTAFTKIYFIFGAIFMIIVFLFNLKIILGSNNNLLRNTFETLLAFTFLSIFVGRSILSEENVLCLIVVVAWILSQLLYISTNKTNDRTKLILFFILLYPYAISIFIEPVVSLFPRIENESFITSNLLIAIPVIISSGYAIVLLK